MTNPPTKKSVILVHGMGEPKKNSLLLTVTNALVTWMDHHRCDRKDGTQIELEERLSNYGPSSIILKYNDQQWKLVEAWWARSFDAPLFDPLVGWTVRRFTTHLGVLAWNVALQSLAPMLLFLAVLTIMVALSPFVGVILIVVGITWAVIGIVRETRRNPRMATVSFTIVAVVGSILAPIFFLGGVNTWLRVVSGFGIFYGSSFALGAIVGLATPLVTFAIRALKGPSTPIWVSNKLAEFSPPSQEFTQKYGVESSWRTTLGPIRFVFQQILVVLERISRPLYRSLQQVDEAALFERLIITPHILGKAGLSVCLAIQVIFHAVNGIITLPLYLAGIVLIIPLMFLVWILSLLKGIPKMTEFIDFIKIRLDSFLVGSLGDIKVFMDEPIQARRIRGTVEAALDNIYRDKEFYDSDIYVIAQSTGAAIAYETLVLNYSNPESMRGKKPKALMTVGSIMSMVWSMRARRTSFDSPLPDGIRWNNYWTRYDPAHAGPIRGKYENMNIDGGIKQRIKRMMKAIWFNISSLFARPASVWSSRRFNLTRDIPVSNEGDPFKDHSAYWDNDHQVIPSLVHEIWGEDAPKYFDFGEKEEADRILLSRLIKRKARILTLSAFRLSAWSVFPLAFLDSLHYLSDGASVATSIWDYLRSWIVSLNSYPILGDILVDPQSATGQVIASFFLALAATFAAQLVYQFVRSVVWDGFLNDMAWFKD